MSKKSRKGKQRKTNAQKVKASTFQKGYWIEWDGELYSLKNVTSVSRSETSVLLTHPEGDIELDVSEQAHVKSLCEQHGEAAVQQCVFYVYVWIRDMLVGGGAAVHDLSGHLSSIVPQQQVAPVIEEPLTNAQKHQQEKAEFDPEHDEIDEERDELIELEEDDVIEDDPTLPLPDQDEAEAAA